MFTHYEVDHDKVILYLPANNKGNGKEFGAQKGELCIAYAFLRILHFHKRHPKYHPGNCHQNVELVFAAFQEIRDKTDRRFDEKYDATVAFFDELLKRNIIEKHPFKDDLTEEELDILFFNVQDYILKSTWIKAQFYPANESSSDEDDEDNGFDEFDPDEIFRYLFGFQKLPIQDFNDLSANDIKALLLKYGPIPVAGELGIDDPSVFPIGSISSENGTQYQLKSVVTSDFHGAHEVTVIGIDTRDRGIIYYLDSNQANVILQVDLPVFLKKLTVIEYFQCEQENIYIKNKISLNKFYSKTYSTNPSDCESCEHCNENLKLKKIISKLDVQQLPNDVDDIEKIMMQATTSQDFFALATTFGMGFFSEATQLSSQTVAQDDETESEHLNKKQKTKNDK